MRRALVAGMTVGSASAFLAAYGPSDKAMAVAASPKRGGTLRVGVTPPSAVDPHMLQDPGGRATVQPAVNYLVRVTPDLKVIPELATEWSSPDAVNWTVKLRQGVKFHNGKPFTADDVVATYDRLVDPKVASAARSAFSFLEKGNIMKVDTYTVRFHLSRPLGDFPYSMFTYQAAILPADWPGDWAKNPVGTGPFKMTSYVPKQRAEFVRNEGYWEQDLPYLDKLQVTYFEDIGAQVTAMQSGTIDLMQDTPLDVISALKAGSPNIHFLEARSSTYAQLAMRVDTKPFDKKQVRQAIAVCLDRPKIIGSLLGGRGDIGNDNLIAPVYPLSKGIRLSQRKQDYAKAKSLLAEAGYSNGVDIELRTHAIFQLPQYAQIVQEMVKPAGVRMEIKVEPDDIYYQHWNTIPFALEAWVHRPSPGQLLNLGYRCGADWNVPHWCNKEFDTLVNQLDATVDPAKRAQIAGQIAALMNDEVPAIISFFFHAVRAMRSNVKGHQADPAGFLDVRRTWVE